MHIALMLLGMITGLSVGTNLTWFLGLPIMAGSLLFLQVGTSQWRERQEAFLLFIGLVCGAILLVVNILT